MRVRFKSTSAIAFLIAGLVAGISLLLFSAAGRATPDRAAVFSGPALLQPTPLFSDFDGDHQPDQAELVSDGTHKSIHLTLSSAWTQHLSFDSRTSERGVLVASDIDHDNDLDLIWVSPSQRSLAVVWLGDGRGNFERAQNSEAYASGVKSLLDRMGGAGIADPQSDDHHDYLVSSSAQVDLEFGHPSRVELRPVLPLTDFTAGVKLAPCLISLRQRGPPFSFSS